jgi:hypothetical protein
MGFSWQPIHSTYGSFVPFSPRRVKNLYPKHWLNSTLGSCWYLRTGNYGFLIAGFHKCKSAVRLV